MAAMTTPITFETRTRSDSHSRTRSGAERTIPSRPTTPLRPPSRTSLRASQTTTPTAGSSLGNTDNIHQNYPLTQLEPAFSEFSDAMADLEANMMHLQLLHESLSRFNETFGAFLYGMNMTAFCVDFPEAPVGESYKRHRDERDPLDDSPFNHGVGGEQREGNVEATFMTSDTSGFVENPPMSSKASSKFSSVPPSTAKSTRTAGVLGRGGASAAGARGTAAGRARGSGIARGTSTRGGTAGTRGSGIARGVGRGRGVR